jgi:hypothetical protein
VSGDGAFSGRRRTGEGLLPFFAVLRNERIQTANGKRQNSNGLQFADISNPKPFAICHLPFELFLVFALKFRGLAYSPARGIDPRSRLRQLTD